MDAAIPKVPKVRIKAGKLIFHPVTLAEIKTSELFEGSALVRGGRPGGGVSKEQYDLAHRTVVSARRRFADL